MLALVFSDTPVLWITREVPEAQSIAMMYPLPNHLCIHFICGTNLVMIHMCPHIPTRSEKKTADICVRKCHKNVVYACGLHWELTVCFVHLFDARVLVPVESEGAISQGIHRIWWKHCDRLVHLCKWVFSPSLVAVCNHTAVVHPANCELFNIRFLEWSASTHEFESARCPARRGRK